MEFTDTCIVNVCPGGVRLSDIAVFAVPVRKELVARIPCVNSLPSLVERMCM